MHGHILISYYVNFCSFVNKNYGIIITYWNCYSVEGLIIAIDGVNHHRTRDRNGVDMKGKPHDIIGWIIRSPVPVEDEIVTIEIAVLRGRIAACDKP